MYIRRYADLPGLYVPDVGEVVIASRSASGPWVPAVVTLVQRRLRNTVRINFEWLEDSGPTVQTPGYHRGEKGHVTISLDGTGPVLIRRRPRPQGGGHPRSEGCPPGQTDVV